MLENYSLGDLYHASQSSHYLTAELAKAALKKRYPTKESLLAALREAGIISLQIRRL